MIEDVAGGGRFERVTLRPAVTLRDGDPAMLSALHHRAHAHCFIARSVNFPVMVEAKLAIASNA